MEMYSLFKLEAWEEVVSGIQAASGVLPASQSLAISCYNRKCTRLFSARPLQILGNNNVLMTLFSLILLSGWGRLIPEVVTKLGGASAKIMESNILG
jgi:hypothetical protein